MFAVVTRFCDTCRQQCPIREFELADGQHSPTCRACAPERPSAAALRAERHERHEQLAALERQRRSLIAALVKIDAEIAELRGRPALSASFERVDPADVFDPDADRGFGD